MIKSMRCKPSQFLSATTHQIASYGILSHEKPGISKLGDALVQKNTIRLTKVHSLATSGHLAPLQYSCTSPPVQHKCKYRGKMIMPSSKFLLPLPLRYPLRSDQPKCPLLSVNSLTTSSYFYLSMTIKV